MLFLEIISEPQHDWADQHLSVKRTKVALESRIFQQNFLNKSLHLRMHRLGIVS